MLMMLLLDVDVDDDDDGGDDDDGDEDDDDYDDDDENDDDDDEGDDDDDDGDDDDDNSYISFIIRNIFGGVPNIFHKPIKFSPSPCITTQDGHRLRADAERINATQRNSTQLGILVGLLEMLPKMATSRGKKMVHYKVVPHS